MVWFPSVFSLFLYLTLEQHAWARRNEEIDNSERRGIYWDGYKWVDKQRVVESRSQKDFFTGSKKEQSICKYWTVSAASCGRKSKISSSRVSRKWIWLYNNWFRLHGVVRVTMRTSQRALSYSSNRMSCRSRRRVTTTGCWYCGRSSSFSQSALR